MEQKLSEVNESQLLFPLKWYAAEELRAQRVFAALEKHMVETCSHGCSYKALHTFLALSTQTEIRVIASILTDRRSRRHKIGPEWSVGTSNAFQAWTPQTSKTTYY